LKMYAGLRYEVMLSPNMGAHDYPGGSVFAPEGIFDFRRLGLPNFFLRL
jgi:hypothetical protein